MLAKRLAQAKAKGLTPPQWLVDASTASRPSGDTQNQIFFTTQALQTVPDQYTEDERIEMMESVVESQSKLKNHLFVMQHRDDGEYLCSVCDADDAPASVVADASGGAAPASCPSLAAWMDSANE